MFKLHKKKNFLFLQFQNPTDKYRFTTVGNKGYSQELYFQNHADESFRRMYRFMKKYFVDSDLAGLAGVMDGSVLNFNLYNPYGSVT